MGLDCRWLEHRPSMPRSRLCRRPSCRGQPVPGLSDEAKKSTTMPYPATSASFASRSSSPASHACISELVNINDRQHRHPGIVEFSNFPQAARNGGLRALLCCRRRTRVSRSAAWRTSSPKPSAIFAEAQSGLQACSDLPKASQVGRLQLCPAGSARRAFWPSFPAARTAIEACRSPDTCFYYPEDRGISRKRALRHIDGRRPLPIPQDAEGR